ncbi:hypothetical protein FF1_018357 [Malus domestica]
MSSITLPNWDSGARNPCSNACWKFQISGAVMKARKRGRVFSSLVILHHHGNHSVVRNRNPPVCTPPAAREPSSAALELPSSAGPSLCTRNGLANQLERGMCVMGPGLRKLLVQMIGRDVRYHVESEIEAGSMADCSCTTQNLLNSRRPRKVGGAMAARSMKNRRSTWGWKKTFIELNVSFDSLWVGSAYEERDREENEEE